MKTSIMSIETCPICGQHQSLCEAYNTRTQEVVRCCNKCGYHFEMILERKDDGSIILPPVYKDTMTLGAGVVCVKFKNSAFKHCFNIPRGSSREDVEKKVREMLKCEEVENVSATWFHEKYGILETVA